MGRETPLRIGIDTLFESPVTGTGGLVYLRNIVRALGEVADRDRLYLFTSASNAHLFDGFSGNLRLVRSGWSNERPLLRIFSQQILIPLLARKFKLDILLCPGNVLPLASNLPMVLVLQNRLLFDLPKEHGFIRRHYRRLVGKLSLMRAAKIVSLSHDLDSYLQGILKVPAVRKVVIPGGVDSALFARQDTLAGRSSKDGYLLVVGELWPYKNHKILLRALAQCLRFQGFSSRLMIVGGDWMGRQTQLLGLARELGVAEKVIFLGRVPHEKMPEVYAGASVLLYPSVAECFALPVLEAMASGVPVITSNCASFPELVGDAGLCLDPHDEQAWANAIHTLLTNRASRELLVQRGLLRSQVYTWAATGAKLLELLRGVAQKKTDLFN